MYAFFNIFAILIKIYCNRLIFSLLWFLFSALIVKGQGNRLSIQATGPKALSICGVTDTANFQIFNISSGSVSSILIRLNLPPGIYYIKSSISGGGVTESNVSNLNQPVFSAPTLNIAKNFKFRVGLSSDCNLLSYLNSNNTPSIQVRVDYLGNYDLGNTIPFSVAVPSAQYGTVSNLSFTGDIGTKFTRSIVIGNYGNGPLRELVLKRVNGKDIKTYFVGSGLTSYKGDTVETRYGPSFFKTIGNKDTFLDKNETFTVIDSNVITGCKNLSTNFELKWGCNNQICQISKLSGSAIISNRTPNLKAIPLPVYPTCYSNNTFKSEIRFVNTGNMVAVSPKVGISSNYYYMFSSHDTSSVRIKIGSNGTWQRPVKDSVSLSYNLGYYGCVGLYPIGLFRVITPDLKPNDTLFLTWNTTSCTPPKCSNASMVINSWAYSAEYLDQCKNKKRINWTWGKVYDQQYCSASSFIPTDLINNQVGEFRTYFNSVSLLNRSTSASYLVDLVLPKGLVHSMQKKDFYFINSDLSATWSPDSIVMRGDTLRAYFPHPVPIVLTGSELVYYLKADCSKTGANGNQTINMQIRYNPDRNCNTQEWLYLFCQSNQLKIHCISNCNGGMKFRDFRVQRINFGLPDNNNDGKPDGSGVLDSTKVREERCLTGDTILAQFHGVVRRSSSNITWRNAYIESTITYGRHLDIAGVQLLVWRRGVTLSVNCNQIKFWKTVSGNQATFKLDLSTDSMQSCVSSGFRYSNDDSLVVRVKYKVTGNIGGTLVNLNFTNRFYTSNVNNPTSNSNKFQCDTFSGQMIMAGYFFTTCCKDIYQVNSCAPLQVNNYYYLGIGGASYGGNNHFPYEYRHFARLKAIRYYLPKGFKLKKSVMSQYRTSGSNKTAFEVKDSLQAISNTATPLTYDVTNVYADSAGPIYGSDDGFHGYYLATIEPSCEIQAGPPTPFKYDFIFERQGTLAPGYDTISSGFSDEIVYNKPVYTIQAVSPTIYAAKDTAEWELNFTNYSSSFSNVNTWFAPDNSGAIKVVQIKDGLKDTLIPSNAQIYRLGTINNNTTRKFKIRAIYNSCKRDSVVLYSGWNCSGYPSDLASYPCFKERIVLYLEPQNTQLQVSLSDSITTADLCAGTPYRMTIENIGSTNTYGTKAILNLPIGMEVVTGSSKIKYPHKGSQQSLSDPILKNGTQFEWNLFALNSDIAKGFKGVGDTNSNKIVITFRVKTSCDYSSGNYIRASASANIKCGDPVLVYPAISNPLNIKGVVRPYYTLLKVDADSIFPCTKSSKVSVKIVNLGPSPTGREDKYQIILPPGLYYDSSLFKSIYNAPDNNLTRIKNINGASEVEFGLLDSILPGDSMHFELGYTADGEIVNCGNIDIYSQTAVKQEVTCISDNSTCKINVSTGNKLIKPVVKKGEVSFQNLESSIQKFENDSEHVKLNFTVRNTGNSIGVNQVIKYVLTYDKDASGTVSQGDEILDIDTIHGPLSFESSKLVTKSVQLKSGKTCALFISLDSTSCSCNFSFSRFPMPPILNAGADRELCSGDTFKAGIGSKLSFRYAWLPRGELSNDTIANPWVILSNTDSAAIEKVYVLTTYRGQCFSKDTVLVKVLTKPDIGILQQDTVLCEGEKVLVKSSYKGGNGLVSLNWSPSQIVESPNSLTTLIKPFEDVLVRVKISDEKSCYAEDTLNIRVKSKPQAKFIYQAACLGQNLVLIDSSFVNRDKIGFKKWTVGGADTLNADTLGIDLYGNPDVFVRLMVSTDFGCKDTFTEQIYLNPYPEALFTTQDVCLGDSSYFINQSRIASGEISKTIWRIESLDSITGTDWKYKFNSADTFTVFLETISEFNCRDTFNRQVIVHEIPESDFTFNDNCLGDTSVFLDNSKFTAEPIKQIVWKVEGDTFHSSSLKYYFTRDTSYQVQQIVMNSFLCSDTTRQTIRIRSVPKAGFSVDRVCEGDSSHFVDSSYIRQGTITKFDYALSDGGSYTASSFGHLFKSGDTFEVRQIVISDFGCRDTVKDFAIVDAGIQPDFTLSNVCMRDTVHIKDASRFLHTNIKDIRYRFGDGDSSVGEDATHLYKQHGRFFIRQEVISTEGCRYDTVKQVDVYPEPKSIFNDSNKCFDNVFDFSSLSTVETGSIRTFRWRFGDGDSAIGNSTNHTYLQPGKYKVELEVETDNGCTDTVSKYIEAYPPVLVNFGAKPVCEGEEMFFFDSSSAPYSSITNYNWEFGDMQKSTLKDPRHLYAQNGIYPVKLEITTAYNCKYDTTKHVEVFPVPQAIFITEPDQATIVNPEIRVTDMSIGADSVNFDLGNGQSTNERQIAVMYPDSGMFYIRQIASNTYGCRDTFVKAIFIRYMFVFNTPTSFTPNNDGQNDIYAPGGIGFEAYEMWVYNRWGELIYNNKDGEGWNGTYMGELLEQDVFCVKFKVKDFKGRYHYYSAMVTLLR